jgi:ligand-binding SRPBCC domain-containing protein
MQIYKLSRKQFLPITKYWAWDFFSSPENLLLVTPRRINVQIQDPGRERIYEGQKIKLRITVLPFVRMDWVTKVTDVVYYECYTLRQTQGPYNHWVHQHKFRSVQGGIELSDEIDYAIKVGGIVGRIINRILVRPQLEKVFNYRSKVIEDFFGVSVAYMERPPDQDSGQRQANSS